MTSSADSHATADRDADGDPDALHEDDPYGSGALDGEDSDSSEYASSGEPELDDRDSEPIDVDPGTPVTIRTAGVGDVNQAGIVAGGEIRGAIQHGGVQNNATVNGGKIETYISQAVFEVAMSETRSGISRQAGGRLVVSRTRDVRWLWSRFVPSDGYMDLLASLRAGRVVLLTGERGSGRATAAIVALRAVALADRLDGDVRGDDVNAGGQPGVGDDDQLSGTETEAAIHTIRDLATAEELRDGGGSWPGPDEIEPGERLLLDLSRTTGALGRSDTERLLDLVNAARSRAAWLAVVVSQRIVEALPMELTTCHVRIGRPNPLAVLAKHLRADGLDVSELDLRGADPDGRLDRLDAGTASRVAQGAPRPTGVGIGQSPSRWLPAALDAVTGNETALFHRFAAQTKPREGGEAAWRIRLASVAMLEGSTGAVITSAERALSRVCLPPGSPAVEPHPFDREDLDSWLSSVGAVQENTSMAGPSQVRFAQSVYGVAVRRYFWIQHPHLAEVYLAWFDQLARAGRDGRSAATLLALRIAEQMLATEAVGELLRLTRRWMRVSDAAHIAAAAGALRLGLDDDASGPLVRRAFYEWSQGSRLNFDGARIVISLCVDPLALTHPDLAITRLMRFLGHRLETVNEAAEQALMKLGIQEDRYRLVMARLLHLLAAGPIGVGGSSLKDRRDRRRRHAARVVLNLASIDQLSGAYPRVFDGQAPPVALREGLVGAWRLVLEEGKDDDVMIARLADWLSAAETSSSDEILDVLAAACERSSDLQGRLSSAALAATRGSTAMRSPAPSRVYRRLLDRIVQGEECLAQTAAAPRGEELGEL